MRTTRFLLASLLFASTFGGCADDDEDWMPPTANGKADGALQILKGSDVPSQYVDAGKHYLASRRITTLERIAALKDVAKSLAHRADGIIANLPANGRLDAAELVRMEKPQIFVTLYPEEQQALPVLWSLLEAPVPNAMAVEIPSYDLTTTSQLVEPSGLTYPTSITISTLPTAMQPAAKRVQLAFNADGNGSTIQVSDIDKVLADPAAFTPTEVTQLKAIKLVFSERATSIEEARASVPAPGTHAKVTTFGQMSLELSTELAIHEHRDAQVSSGSGSVEGLTVTLKLEATNAMTLHAPDNSDVVVLEIDSGDETVFDDANIAYTRHTVGNVVIERYEMGVRKETHDVALPSFKVGAVSTSIDDLIDYRLFAGNSELHKNVYDTDAHISPTGQKFVTVDSRYEATSQTADINQPLVDLAATPPFTLPTGRYELPVANLTLALDLYPQGVVIAHYNGHTGRLLPAYYNRKAFHGTGSTDFWFLPDSNAVFNSVAEGYLTVDLRTK